MNFNFGESLAITLHCCVNGIEQFERLDAIQAFNDAAFFMDTLGFERSPDVKVPSVIDANFRNNIPGQKQHGQSLHGLGVIFVQHDLDKLKKVDTIHHELCHTWQPEKDGEEYIESSKNYKGYQAQRVEREARAVGAMAETAALIGRDEAIKVLDEMKALGFGSYAAAHAARWVTYVRSGSSYNESRDMPEFRHERKATTKLVVMAKSKKFPIYTTIFRAMSFLRGLFE
jgi:hypothetical protein